MRTLNVTASNLLASGHYGVVQLLELQLSTTIRLCTAGFNITWGGFTWQGAAAIGEIGEVDQQPGEMKGLTFTLNGVPDANVALAMSEPVQGKKAILYTAIFDPATYQAADAVVEDVMVLDVMTAIEGAIVNAGDPITVSISVSSESAAIDLLRPRGLLYTDGHQQRLHPGDKGLEYVRDSDLDIVWPGKNWKP